MQKFFEKNKQSILVAATSVLICAGFFFGYSYLENRHAQLATQSEPLAEELADITLQLIEAEEVLFELQRRDYAFSGALGAEYLLLKQAAIEEAGEDLASGAQNVVDIIFNRVASALYPDTIEQVLKEYQVVKRSDGSTRKLCQFSYWCDDINAPLTAAQGEQFDTLIEPIWVAYVHGEYDTNIKAHSFVAPYALSRSDWHLSHDCVAYDGIHYFYSGIKKTPATAQSCLGLIRPVHRPDDLLLAAVRVPDLRILDLKTSGLESSPRPKARPIKPPFSADPAPASIIEAALR